MTPVNPDVSLSGWTEVVYAKGQPQYRPLPALQQVGAHGRIVTRWRLTAEELEAVLAGSDVYLEILTFGQPLQPVVLGVWSECVSCMDGPV